MKVPESSVQDSLSIQLSKLSPWSIVLGAAVVGGVITSALSWMLRPRVVMDEELGTIFEPSPFDAFKERLTTTMGGLREAVGALFQQTEKEDVMGTEARPVLKRSTIAQNRFQKLRDLLPAHKVQSWRLMVESGTIRLSVDKSLSNYEELSTTDLPIEVEGEVPDDLFAQATGGQAVIALTGWS